MIVAGLTGSIAMGKSETARMFAAAGVPVFDSDAAVHALYRTGGSAVRAIAELVPGAVVDDAVDRGRLAAAVQAEPALLKRIEDAVHPLVRDRQQAFLADAVAKDEPLAVLDIPLLFETGREAEVDAVIVVSAGPELQRQRALARPGMTPEKLAFIMSRQVPDTEKRARADFVIDTSVGLEETRREVERVVGRLKAMRKG